MQLQQLLSSCISGLHFCLSLLRTQSLSVGDWEDQEDFPNEFTLHPDPITPEGLPCTPANAVELHRDSQPGEEKVLLGMHKTSAGKMRMSHNPQVKPALFI